MTRSGSVRDRYLLTLLDCPPSLGPLTVNALVAADSVLVPVQTEYFALEGLAGMLDTLGLIQRELNPRLTISGMILTMHDGRTRLAREVEREVREHFPQLVFDTVIPRSVRLGEAPSFGVPVLAARPAQRRARPRTCGWPRRSPPVPERPSPGLARHRGAADRAGGTAVPWDAGSPRSSLAARAPTRASARSRWTSWTRIRTSPGRASTSPRSRSWPSRSAPAACFSRSWSARCPAAATSWWRASAGCAPPASPSTELIPAVVRHTEDWEGLDLALAENMAREDLNAVEEARACAMLVEDLGLTKEEVGRRVGRSRVAISNLIRLLALPEDVLEMIEGGELSEGHGRAILICKDHGERRSLARSARDEGWSVRETERRSREHAGIPPRKDRAPVVVHPDLAEALAAAEDAMGAALGRDVKVRARGSGCVVEVPFDSPADAIEFARRTLRRAV